MRVKGPVAVVAVLGALSLVLAPPVSAVARRGPLRVTSSSSFPSRVAPDTFGTNAQYIQNMGWVAGYPPRSERDKHLAAMDAAGVRVARAPASWWAAEPYSPTGCPGADLSNTMPCDSSLTPVTHNYTWTVFDDWATDLARHNIRWMPIVMQTAAWSSVYGCCMTEPRSADEFATFAAAVAKRYGGSGARKGDFWVAHPELAYLPVRWYEIWNEPNLNANYEPFPNPLTYGRLYKAARTSIKAVDADATVLVGGLSDGDNTPGDFVKNMFLTNPGLVVDGIGLHPYAVTSARYIAQVLEDTHEFRRVLDLEVGIPEVDIYITEVGWTTDGEATWFQQVPDDAADGTPNRREALVKTADLLTRSNCGVRAFQPHTWWTLEQNPDNLEDWFGIVNQDGTLKPSGQAFSDRVKLLQGEGTVAPPTDVVGLCDDLGR
jgi:hypothetical protein